MKQIEKILISGAGISGLTLAWWLKKYGFKPTIIDKAPSRRLGGYIINFWGLGYDVLEKMNFIGEAKQYHIDLKKFMFVNRHGKKIGAINISKLRKIIDFRHFNFLRSDLEEILYNAIKDTIDIHFNKSIQKMKETNEKVDVLFDDGDTDSYDLVIGADGIHSNTRKFLFGSENNYEHFLGYSVASYTIDDFLDNEKMFYMYGVPNKQAGIYSILNNKLVTLFFWKSKRENYHSLDILTKKQILIDEFKNIGWITNDLLDKMKETADFYLDSINQIKLEQWYKGRVVLVGDACQCVSLVTGQGSALGMAGSYILAGELNCSRKDYRKAFENYQNKLYPEVIRKQKMAQRFIKSLVPKRKTSIWFNNKISNLMLVPVISKWFIKKFLMENVELDDYI